MEHKDDRQDGKYESQVDQAEMDYLTAHDQKRKEQERMQALIEQRRLEFARWLVTTGRINEHMI